jgi:two-component system cell cycle sensor histidine kinase/response regulator CckA
MTPRDPAPVAGGRRHGSFPRAQTLTCAPGSWDHVTDLPSALEALRVSESRYRTLFEDSLTGNYVATPGGVLVACNAALARILGFESVQDLLAQNWSSLWVDQANRAHVLDRLRRERRLEREVLRLRHHDGQTLHLIANFVGTFDAHGTLIEVHGQLFDDTERQTLEAQVRQSQKMEAIGQLAGGIAHDFNNLLMPILGYTDLLESEYGGGPLTEPLSEIRRAADRASALTRQLLAFGRRQMLQPRSTDINVALGTMKQLLARTLGEDVELRVHMAPSLWKTIIDPSQIEQALLNLALNARDAMPDGGTLTIETSNVELDAGCEFEHVRVRPGSYVLLEIGDTGCGMEEHVRTRAFEPFFTTKQQKGTGLGLASVYGIVKQNNGYVWLDSTPGQGTSFRLYFPKATQEHTAPPDVEPQVPAATTTSGTETILLVEDMEAVRDITAKVLGRAGYTVLSAATPREALDLSRGHRDRIDLLLSDIVMPEMNGPDLSKRLVVGRPELRLLFMSGYAAAAPNRETGFDIDADFLAKPFRPGDLLVRVREILDRQAA